MNGNESFDQEVTLFVLDQAIPAALNSRSKTIQPVSPSPSTPASSCGVWWSGLYHERSMKWWNPVANTTPVETEIRDGAICTIMTDSNNDGVINKADNVEKKKSYHIGRVMSKNDDDDNGNFICDLDEKPDLYETPNNLKNLSGQQHDPEITVENEDDLAETILYVWIDSLDKRAGVATEPTIDVCMDGQIAWNVWTKPTKGDRLHFCESGVPETKLAKLTKTNLSFVKTVYVEALSSQVRHSIYLNATPNNGPATSDLATYRTLNFDLTPYTPQTKYIDPMAIPKANWKNNGVGIRRNTDYDNGGTSRDNAISANIPNENDLIKTYVSMTPVTGIKFVLKQSSQTLAFWGASTKNNDRFLIPQTGKQITSGGTIWAEWTDFSNGTCTLTYQAILESTGRVLCEEELVYRPFESVTCAFVGENQTAGDATVSPGVNDWVIQELLNGYDVHVWDDGHDVFSWGQDCNAQGNGPAFDEVVNAVNNRGVSNVAMIGYSHGGGSVYNLSRRIAYDAQGYFIIGYTDEGTSIGYTFESRLNVTPNIVFTSYIDAIRNDNWADNRAEVRKPENTQYHVNQFQTNTIYLGGIVPLNGAHSDPLGDIDENRSFWRDKNGNKLKHDTIDDNIGILDVISTEFEDKVGR